MNAFEHNNLLHSTKIIFEKTRPDAIIPYKKYYTDAGFDLVVCERVDIRPSKLMYMGNGVECIDIPTGIRLEMPGGVFGRITGRSSTIRRLGLMVVEGIIDPGYRGELYFAVINFSQYWRILNPGDRIAQLILHNNLSPDVNWVEGKVNKSDRGENGFGSTGGDCNVQ